MHMRVLLTALPLEIWQQIFAHACTDGGYTGTSLTLVNKFFYSASHSVRFQSLSFSSLVQLESFLSYIRNRQQKYREHCDSKLRIRHLLLSFSSAIFTEPPSSNDVGPSQSLNVWYMMRQQREHEKAAWDRRYLQLVPSLLQLAAPYLETLALLQSDAFTIPAVRTTLPHLRELTLLVGISVTLGDEESEYEPSSTSSPGTLDGTLPPETGYAHFTLNAFSSPPAIATTSPTGTAAVSAQSSSLSPATTSATASLGDRPHARFPALERLHLICGRHRDWTLRGPLAHLARLAPALTHLRISNATYTHGQDDSIPGFLRDALGMQGPLATLGDGDTGTSGSERAPMLAPSALVEAPSHPGEEVANAAAAGPPQLRRVVLHSVPPPDEGRCGHTHKDYCRLVGAVQAIAAACECSEDVHVRWIEGERMRSKDWGQLIRAQWMDRITGGGGCWEDDDLKQASQG